MAFFLVLLSGPGNLVADGFSKHMNKANEFMSKGEFESAITEYQAALQQNPNSVRAQSWMGIAYERLGDRLSNNGETDRAIEAYKNALAKVPEEPYWHERLGIALGKKGDREAAIKEYRTAAELSPLDEGLQRKYLKATGGPQGPEAARGGVSEPIPIHKPDPPYSKRARQAKLQGTLVLWVDIDREGNVTDTIIVKPLGLGLDANALETVRTWKFQPAMRNGTPVPARVMVVVRFKTF